MSADAQGPRIGPDGYFHIIWFWRDTPSCETNHDLSYARSQDLVHWETADGSSITLPINPDTEGTVVDPVPPGGGVINGGAKLFFDQENQPLIAYMKYDQAGKSQLFLTRLSNLAWENQQVSNWDYRWAFSGPGSIDFEIKVKNAYLDAEGKIMILYDHIKKDHGELVIDPETLKPIADRSVVQSADHDFPTTLLQPISNIDSVSVQWLKATTIDKAPGTYYALRWETMGKRRFYQPPDQIVKPSLMRIYLLQKGK